MERRKRNGIEVGSLGACCYWDIFSVVARYFVDKVTLKLKIVCYKNGNIVKLLTIGLSNI